MNNKDDRAKEIVKRTIEHCKKKYWEFMEAFDILKPKKAPFGQWYDPAFSSDGEILYYITDVVIAHYNHDQYESLSYDLMHVILHMLFDDPETYRNTDARKLFDKYADLRNRLLLFYLDIPDDQIDTYQGDFFDPRPAMRSYYEFEDYVEHNVAFPDSFFALRKSRIASKRVKSSFPFNDMHELWLEPMSEEAKQKWTKLRIELGLMAQAENENGNKGMPVAGTAEDKGDDKDKQDMSLELNSMKQLMKECRQGRDNAYGKHQGQGAGDERELYKAAKENKRTYIDILSEFFTEKESDREDPEVIDRMMYSYGFDLYEDVALIEPSEDTDKKSLGTVAIAIDTSGSCSGDVAEKFLRELSNLFRDISSASSFEKVIFYQCDYQIQRKEVIEESEDLSFESGAMDLWGFGGTSFVPVFEDLDKEMSEKETNVDALIYLTDSYGDYPEKKPPYPTFFIMPENNYREDNLDMPDWIRKLSIEEDAKW